MNAHTEGSNSSLMGEVLTAVTDFSRLAQQAGSVSAVIPGTIASDLLVRLLQVCDARRGAILLLDNDREERTRGFTPASLRRAMTRVLALHKVDEEDALQLLSGFSSTESGEMQDISEIPQWLCWRLVIPTTVAFERRTAESEVVENPLALILLGWTDNKSGGKPARVKRKGPIVLPLLTEAVSAVIVNLLLAERVKVLEHEMERTVKNRMENLKSEMLATVNHELRSPLTAIKGYTATLLHHEHRISREERQEFLRAIYDGSLRMEVLIGRLLELSQLETGEFQLNRSIVDLTHLVREAITAVEQRLSLVERSIEIKITVIRPTSEVTLVPASELDGTEVPDELLVFVDRQRLREVFDNVLENAIVYSPEGGVVEIGIRVFNPVLLNGDELPVPSSLSQHSTLQEHEENLHLAQLKQAGHVEIWICDHGIGIGSEHITHIFERFYRADTRLTREANGLGLGLAICKRIVELHGGLIWAESLADKGSTFHVVLPVSSDEIIQPLAQTKKN